MQSPFPSPPLPQPGEGGKGDSREAAWLVVKRHLEKKTGTFLFVKWKLKCAKSKPCFALRAKSTNNGALLALSIKAALRAQSKPRCAINQSRASRAIKIVRFTQSKPRCARNQIRASRGSSLYKQIFFRASRVINIFRASRA
jgi:hypothetical protein